MVAAFGVHLRSRQWRLELNPSGLLNLESQGLIQEEHLERSGPLEIQGDRPEYLGQFPSYSSGFCDSDVKERKGFPRCPASLGCRIRGGLHEAPIVPLYPR